MKRRHSHTSDQVQRYGTEIEKRVLEYTFFSQEICSLVIGLFFIVTIAFLAFLNYEILEVIGFLLFFSIFCCISPMLIADEFDRRSLIKGQFIFYPFYKKQRLVHLFLTILISIVGMSLIVIGTQNIQAAIESSTWPSANGTITISKLEKILIGGGSAIATVDELETEYKYYVRDRELIGNRIFWKAKKHNREYVQKYSILYSKGVNINAFYNPNQPEQALLEPGFRWRVIEELLFGFMGVLSSLLNLEIQRNWKRK